MLVINWITIHSCPVNSIEEPELSVLHMSRHFQGEGIGYKLLTHAEQEVKKDNVSGLWLITKTRMRLIFIIVRITP
ncbi:MAG: GNAT family N-acetyltransferase [Labilibaculum antarcticum]